MSKGGNGSVGILEVAAVVIVVAFAVTVLFVFLSAIAGAIWWTIKLLLLVAVLYLVLRWAFNRSKD